MRALITSGTTMNGIPDFVVQVRSGAVGTPPLNETLEIYGVDQYVYGGGGTFTINPFTGQRWTVGDLQTIWVGALARWRRAGAFAGWQRLSFNDYTVEVVYFAGPVPTLTVSSPTVPRTGAATFTVTADPTADPAAVVSNWTFTSPGLAPVVRTAGASSTTWSGLIVAPGTASVRVEQNGEVFNLSAPIGVTPRNWAWMPAAPANVPNGTFETLPSPPIPLGRVGASRLDQGFLFQAGTITDGGPNHGVLFAASLGAGSIPTRYRYQIVPDLTSRKSEFYKAQCGSYSIRRPNGFIRGRTLLSNVKEHEYGTVLGHYQQYGAALATAADNPGTVAEAQLASPGADGLLFEQEVPRLTNEAIARVGTAMQFEACNRQGEYDTSCTFRGRVMYFPYTDPCR